MNGKQHILVVDDDDLVRKTVETSLASEGFRVSGVPSGAAMRDVMARDPAKLVIVDLVMPGEDGFALTRFLRERYHCGIIMLSGNTDPTDSVVGLEVGADDYIIKPYQRRDLLARIRSVLRRVNGEPQHEMSPALTPASEVVKFAHLQLDLHARHVIADTGETVELTSGEFNLLNEFVTKPGRVLSREHLLTAVHNRDWEYFDRSIDVLVTRLRHKLEVNSSRPEIIKTVRGAGYIFTAQITRLPTQH